MKYFILVFLLLCITEAFSQQPEAALKEKKGEWIFTAYFGNATLTAKKSFKVNANVAGGFIGKEFVVSNSFSLITGITNQHVRASYNDTQGLQSFITNNSLQLPVTARYSGDFESGFSYFVSFGGYGSYLYSATVENEISGQDDKIKGLGFNFGLVADIGIKKYFTEHLSISVGLKTQGDQFQSYKDDKQEFELTNVYLFEVGIGYRF
ncbi:outer membrane beta-barrel protein [Cochleicola gelatinilyticus]|uniref:outer membrane beta-barrel protein n=1 Tax=Cochleicola gelatinilyticus TaxID=1763537 RepID=UPI0009EEA992|nr:outer membrane beta-barrel protein [Cochleicola gelatinilyticus]